MKSEKTKSIMSLLAALSLSAALAASYEWTGSGGDLRLANPDNWSQGASPTGDESATMVFKSARIPEGAALTNDLPFGPYHRMTFADGARSMALDGSAIGITRSLDNSTPSSGGVTQTFKMPVTACGNLQVEAESATRFVFEKPFLVAASNDSVNPYVEFCGAGTNVLKGGVYAPKGCYAGQVYGGDKTGFKSGTFIIEGDCVVPSLYIDGGAHVIITNATLGGGWASGNFSFIRTCTIDIMNGGRFVGEQCGVMLAQGTTSACTTLNVFPGGFLDTGTSSMRFGDDGRVTLNVEGGTVFMSCGIAFASGGTFTLNVNSGQFVSSCVQSETSRMHIGYARSKNSGLPYEDTLNLNGGEMHLAGFVNSCASSTTAQKFYLNFNGGTIVAKRDTNAFYANDNANASATQIVARVRAGGLKFDTRGQNTVVWNGISLLDNEGAADGGFVKLGEGRLYLSSVCQYTGTNRVERGSLGICAPNASAMLDVRSGAICDISDPAYFTGGAVLASGARLVFDGGTLSLTSLKSSAGAVRLGLADNDAGQRLSVPAAGLDLSGGLLFTLVDSSKAAWTTNGTYTLLESPGLPAAAALLVAVENPVAGKSYSFAVANGALQVTVSDGPAADMVLIDTDTTLNEPLAVSGIARVHIAAGCTLTLAGGVSGTSSDTLVFTGPGTLVVEGSCGARIAVGEGTLSIASAQSIAGGVALSGGATLVATADVATSAPVEVLGPANVSAAAGCSLALNGTVAGSGSILASGAGTVKVADASGLAGGITIVGVMEFAAPPAMGPLRFAGGTFLYTGAADAALDVPLEVLTSGNPGATIRTAPGAGSLDVFGPLWWSSSLYMHFFSAPGGEIVFRGGAWNSGASNSPGSEHRTFRLDGGDFRFASDCSMRIDGNSSNARMLAFGNSSATSQDAVSVRAVVDDGAKIFARNVSMTPPTSVDSGADVSVVQNGGSFSFGSFNMGEDQLNGNNLSYVLNGGTFSGPDGWLNLKHGDGTFAVKGGSAAVASFAFGYQSNGTEQYRQTNDRKRGYYGSLEVDSGEMTVTKDFGWMSDSDIRRHSEVKVSGAGRLTLPPTFRAWEATTPVWAATLSVDGGELSFPSGGSRGVASDYLAGLDDFVVGPGGATIDVPAEAAVVTQRIRPTTSSGGALVKTGAGELTLSASNNVVFGGVDVRGGLLRAGFDQAPQKGWPAGLAALWTFDGDDPLSDSSGHGYDLIQLHPGKSVVFTNGDETIGVSRGGNAAYWQVAGGSLAMTNSVVFDWNAHTVSFWVRLKNFNQYKGLISFASTRSKISGENYASLVNNDWCICLKGSGNTLRFDSDPNIYPGVSPEDTQAKFTAGEWHMITSVRDAQNVWEYIDGEPVTPGGGISATYAGTRLKAENAIFSIGQTYGGFDTGNEYINAGAMMDDFAVFSRALTADEVAAMFADSQRAPAPPVAVAAGAVWDMNGCVLATRRLSGAGAVTNGVLSVEGEIALDPEAAQPLHVANPVFPSGEVTVDLGRTAEDPVKTGTRVTVLTFDSLAAASEANVSRWKASGTGLDKRFVAKFSVDRASNAVVLDVIGGGTVISFK